MGSNKRRKLSDGSYEEVGPSNLEERQAHADQHGSTHIARNRSLFIRSLPESVTTERLTEWFSQRYLLRHAVVVIDPTTKVSRGYGFVTLVDAEDAQAAAAEFDGSVLDGRKIKVELAAARHRDVSGEGGKSGPNMTGEQLREQRQKKRAENQPPKLIVRNLPWSIKEPEDLAALFRSYGKVKHTVVPKRSPKVQAGFGFVILRGHKNAEKAIQGVNGKIVDGRTLAVDWAVDKKTWKRHRRAKPT